MEYYEIPKELYESKFNPQIAPRDYGKWVSQCKAYLAVLEAEYNVFEGEEKECAKARLETTTILLECASVFVADLLKGGRK